MGTWLNNDGLYIRYGVDTSKVARGGALAMPHEDEHQWTLEFSAADLNGTTTVIFDEVLLQKGLFISSATLTVTTAFTSVGDAGTLTIGVIEQNRSTAIDADGIDVEIAEGAIDADGDVVACNGALVGTALTDAGYLTMVSTGSTNAFTAGAARLVIAGHIPT